MKIVFMGTPDFAVASLSALKQANFDIVGVVTAADKPAGRGQQLNESAVKKYAIANGLKVLQPLKLKDPGFIADLKALKADLFVVVAFRMLPEIIWNAPTRGSMNLHASLLPNYRGAAPIQHAIINGETETGVTTFFLKHEIDTGDIIERERVTIDPTDNASSLHDKLMVVGAEVVVKSLQRIEKEGDNIILIPQNPANNEHSIKNQQLVTAHKLSREFCEITKLNSVKEVLNKIRGLSNYPGAWITSPWGEMKILEAKPVEFQDNQVISATESENSFEPFYILHNNLFLKCLDGNFLEIKRLKLSGKSEMDGKSLVNGLKSRK